MHLGVVRTRLPERRRHRGRQRVAILDVLEREAVLREVRRVRHAADAVVERVGATARGVERIAREAIDAVPVGVRRLQQVLWAHAHEHGVEVRPALAETAGHVGRESRGVTDQAIADEVGGIFVKADVTNADDVANMYKVAFDTYGSIDIAFNNAGISPPDDDSILTTGIDAWRRVQEVNLTSVYLCCKEVLPYMLEQKKGSIINTASFVATMAAATSQISYTASKGGVLSMSRELGVQFARENIRVNALCPGPVNTPLLQELFASIRGTGPFRFDGEWLASSCLLGIMGRMAAYTGQEITWEMAMNSKESIVPDVSSWDAKVEFPAMAMPGRTRSVRTAMHNTAARSL